MLEDVRARAANALAPSSIPDAKTPAAKLSARGGLGTVADLCCPGGIISTVNLAIGGPVPQVVLALLLGFIAMAFMVLSFRLQRQQARQNARNRRNVLGMRRA